MRFRKKKTVPPPVSPTYGRMDVGMEEGPIIEIKLKDGKILIVGRLDIHDTYLAGELIGTVDIIGHDQSVVAELTSGVYAPVAMGPNDTLAIYAHIETHAAKPVDRWILKD